MAGALEEEDDFTGLGAGAFGCEVTRAYAACMAFNCWLTCVICCWRVGEETFTVECSVGKAGLSICFAFAFCAVLPAAALLFAPMPE